MMGYFRPSLYQLAMCPLRDLLTEHAICSEKIAYFWEVKKISVGTQLGDEK
jgi:hypothetical protein